MGAAQEVIRGADPKATQGSVHIVQMPVLLDLIVFTNELIGLDAKNGVIGQHERGSDRSLTYGAEKDRARFSSRLERSLNTSADPKAGAIILTRLKDARPLELRHHHGERAWLHHKPLEVGQRAVRQLIGH